jgi:glycyl-tRNA synthetase alpha chain
MTFQGLILKLSEFWASRGCVLQQPLDVEVGAGTMHPETFLRVLGPAHWNVAYVQPSRRPADGRFGENPNRLFKHYQFQVILKPAPDEVQQLYLESLEACGINPRQHDIRFEEDNWESPTLGAWGIGWQVMFDGMEISQFTYFQQAGGLELSPTSAELTYGLERIAMVLQRVDSIYDIEWAPGVKYRDVRLREEVEQSKYVFGQVDLGGPGSRDFGAFHRDLFERNYQLAGALLKAQLVWPALEHTLKCSHLFNILDSSNSIGVTERTAFILRIRQLAIGVAKAYVEEDTAARQPAGAAGHAGRGGVE